MAEPARTGPLRTVGLIGPIGAGKSVVADELAACGAAVIRADDISREVLAPGSATLAAVAAVFGDEVLDEGGALKRRELGHLVFADPKARRRLEEIVHPAMVARIEAQLAELRAKRPVPALAVVEAANLVEMGGAHLVDELVMVTAPREERLRRIVERDGLSREEAQDRLRAHEELGIEGHRADHVIVATGEAADTRVQAQQLWGRLVEEGGRRQ